MPQPTLTGLLGTRQQESDDARAGGDAALTWMKAPNPLNERNEGRGRPRRVSHGNALSARQRQRATAVAVATALEQFKTRCARDQRLNSIKIPQTETGRGESERCAQGALGATRVCLRRGHVVDRDDLWTECWNESISKIKNPADRSVHPTLT